MPSTASGVRYITVDGIYGQVVIEQATGDYTYTLGATSAQAAAVAALGHDVTVQDDFTYTASDGMLGGEGHLKVNITGVGEAPVLSAESITVEENGDAAVTTTVFDIKLSDDDPAYDVTITASAVHGTLTPAEWRNRFGNQCAAGQRHHLHADGLQWRYQAERYRHGD